MDVRTPTSDYSEIDHLSFVVWENDPARRSRYMAMLTAYLDESRTDEGKAYPVIGGYLAPVEAWLAFSSEWKAILREEGIPCFHAAECWGNIKKSVFEDRQKWTMREKERLIGRLLTVVEAHVFRGVVSSLDNQAYLKLIGDRKASRHKHGSQYELCGFSTAILVGEFAESKSPFPISFVFDQGNRYRHQFERGYEIVRRGPQPFVRFLGPLTFASDERVVPLQAADLYAWTLARSMHETLADRRPASVPWAERLWYSVPRLENFMYPETLAKLAKNPWWTDDRIVDAKALSRFLRTVKPASHSRR